VNGNTKIVDHREKGGTHYWKAIIKQCASNSIEPFPNRKFTVFIGFVAL